MLVQWDTWFSDHFTVTNEVNNCGLLSPHLLHLFAIYLMNSQLSWAQTGMYYEKYGCKQSNICFFFIFSWASCSNHYLAALDLGAGVEQPFDWPIVQNHQTMQAMGRLMDWTLEDNVVDGLFFFTTLTGRRRNHTPLVKTGAGMPDTGADVVKLDPGPSWEGHSGVMGTSVGDENAESECGVMFADIMLMFGDTHVLF